MKIHLRATHHVLPLLFFSLFSLRQAESKTIECKDGTDVVQARIISDVGYGESPVKYKGKLYFVGYTDDAVWVWDGKTTRKFWSSKGCGPAAVTSMESFVGNVFLVNCYSQNQIGEIAVVSENGETIGNLPVPAPNDFAHHPTRRGVFVTSSTSASEKGYFGFNATNTGSVYFISRRLIPTLLKADRALAYANGIAVLPDGNSLYVAETYKNQISRFQIQETRFGVPKGLIEVDSKAIDLNSLFAMETTPVEPRGPDGIRIGGSDRKILVAAQYQGGRIVKTTLSGLKIGEITISGENGVSYPNTTNVDIDGNTLTISANTTSTDGRNPGVILELTDPQLMSRAHLACTIKE